MLAKKAVVLLNAPLAGFADWIVLIPERAVLLIQAKYDDPNTALTSADVRKELLKMGHPLPDVEPAVEPAGQEERASALTSIHPHNRAFFIVVVGQKIVTMLCGLAKVPVDAVFWIIATTKVDVKMPAAHRAFLFEATKASLYPIPLPSKEVLVGQMHLRSLLGGVPPNPRPRATPTTTIWISTTKYHLSQKCPHARELFESTYDLRGGRTLCKTCAHLREREKAGGKQCAATNIPHKHTQPGEEVLRQIMSARPNNK